MRSLAVALLRIVALGLVALALLVSGGTPAYAWSYPAALNTNASGDSGDDYGPSVATDGGGNWVAVWLSRDSLGDTIGTDEDILVAYSTDDGGTWSDPAALNSRAADDSANDKTPQVTTDGAGNWLAVWYSWDDLGGTIGTDTDILVSRSTDNGATWTAQAALNTNAATDSAGDQLPVVTTDGGGNWVAVWQGSVGSDGDILVSRSTTEPTWPWTWSDPAALNTNAATDSGTDWKAHVATDGGGNWVAVWESSDDLGDTIGTDEDVLVAYSTDNGATWVAPQALNSSAATDSAGDISPEVATDGGGNWVAVWYSNDDLGGTIGTDTDILVSRSTNNAANWTAQAALNINAATDSGDDKNPTVAADGGGNWVAVWYSHDDLGGTIGTDRDILVARSTDNGVTWTDPAALNTNAATDLGQDYHPEVATNRGSNWVTGWMSDDSLGGSIGTDFDVLYATEVWPAAPVGGIAEVPDVSGSSAPNYIALAALAAAALVAVTMGASYARRRWLG